MTAAMPFSGWAAGAALRLACPSLRSGLIALLAILLVGVAVVRAGSVSFSWSPSSRAASSEPSDGSGWSTLLGGGAQAGHGLALGLRVAWPSPIDR